MSLKGWQSGHHIAVDLGASGGKMAAARFDGKHLLLEEYITLENTPVRLGPAFYWDIFALYQGILQGLAAYADQGVQAATLGVDTWGASYGFLDKKGRLLEPVFHYRDARTETVMEALFARVPQRELFALTGCQCNRTYTLPQLYASVLEESPCLQSAHKMLFLPDLFSYFLCGEATSERSIAGTSTLLNTAQDEWQPKVFERFDIPQHFLTPLVDAGSKKGKLLPRLAAETGMAGAEVIASIGHDSAAGVAAIPDFGPGKLYVSIGTNVSMGIEGERPLLSDEAFAGVLKNTGGMERTIITYRDFPAFWLMNGLRSSWQRQGKNYSYPELEEMAKAAKSTGAVVDPEDPAFGGHEADMLRQMQQYLKDTNQPLPQTDGEFARCVLESLALKIKNTAESMQHCSGVPLTEVFVINGGARNGFLVQLISDALGLPLRAGMPYATLAGNLLCQVYSSGGAASLGEMREIAKSSFEMAEYMPKPGLAKNWAERLAAAREKGLCR